MWALAHDLIERDRCPGCGQPLSESTDPSNDDAYLGHAVRCHGCKAAKSASQTVDGDPGGLHTWVEKPERG